MSGEQGALLWLVGTVIGLFFGYLLCFVRGRRFTKINVNEHGMPVYFEIHKGHRSGDLNFGVMTGLLEEFTVAEMQEFRQTVCVALGLAERAFQDSNSRRHPAATKSQR